MNLIPLNNALSVARGDIDDLPSATTWQQLVLSGEDAISIFQADMNSAFYLFHLPPFWLQYMSFNIRFSRQELGLSHPGFVRPTCRVLPMGWSSSVGLVQWQAVNSFCGRSSPAPVSCVVPLPSLDGLAIWRRSQGSLSSGGRCTWRTLCPSSGSDALLHGAAVSSWNEAGVLCSEDKHVLQTAVGTELGVEINGPLGLLGAGGDRLFQTVQATLALLNQSFPRTKHCQIVLGRWIFILQFQRPGMSFLNVAWDYISKAHLRPLQMKLKRELAMLIGICPLLHSDLRLPFDETVTCSDASERGGAVAVSMGL